MLIQKLAWLSTRFGDKGCLELCKGLASNTSLLSLNLSYCDLTAKSGEYLGDLLCTTALR